MDGGASQTSLFFKKKSDRQIAAWRVHETESKHWFAAANNFLAVGTGLRNTSKNTLNKKECCSFVSIEFLGKVIERERALFLR